ncbi:fused MFS/spermidine synthase [Paraburkholderia aromaticivorans]|uniref:Spermidine synthase n=1 Tax=Paraburkholderia aromaticivorans TaxID=2026199 RepID=A0A248VVP4_9BURK|nr:fused MFS/spermidine synthase [Paraburkholderia aromaticivorans]ASW03106.1 spermidine synthase [Paraburkholderia aromaticivorans]
MSANHHHFRQALAELLNGPPGNPVPVVSDGLRKRSLRFGPLGIQSSMRKRDPFELDLPYTRAMMTFGLFHHAPRDILIVGLGGGSLSKYCFQKFPSARVTTVEIDANVIALREIFFVPPDSERFHIVHADAAAYLSHRTGIADVILLDGFDATGLPAALSSQSFYDSCRAALRDKGVLVSNLLNNDARLATHLARMRRACDANLLRTTAQCGANVIAVGFKRRTVPGWDDLHARAKALTTSLGLDLRRHVKRMEHHHREESVSGYPSSGEPAVEHDI